MMRPSARFASTKTGLAGSEGNIRSLRASEVGAEPELRAPAFSRGSERERGIRFVPGRTSKRRGLFDKTKEALTAGHLGRDPLPVKKARRFSKRARFFFVRACRFNKSAQTPFRSLNPWLEECLRSVPPPFSIHLVQWGADEFDAILGGGLGEGLDGFGGWGARGFGEARA